MLQFFNIIRPIVCCPKPIMRCTLSLAHAHFWSDVNAVHEKCAKHARAFHVLFVFRLIIMTLQWAAGQMRENWAPRAEPCAITTLQGCCDESAMIDLISALCAANQMCRADETNGMVHVWTRFRNGGTLFGFLIRFFCVEINLLDRCNTIR